MGSAKPRHTTTHSQACLPRKPPRLAAWLHACVLVVGALSVSACDSPPPPPQLQLHDGDTSTPYVSPKSCDNGLVWTRNGCIQPADIKVNTVGYLPTRAKFATVPA